MKEVADAMNLLDNDNSDEDDLGLDAMGLGNIGGNEDVSNEGEVSMAGRA